VFRVFIIVRGASEIFAVAGYLEEERLQEGGSRSRLRAQVGRMTPSRILQRIDLI
jgi:hypothetical protein